MKRARHLAGYSLVEIFIVLTVMMMLASALGVNYYQSIRDQRIAETKETIEQVKDALVHYAARHQSRAFQVERYFSPVRILWDVPPQRPYLPCPDVTLDGFEDRAVPQPDRWISPFPQDRVSYYSLALVTIALNQYQGIYPPVNRFVPSRIYTVGCRSNKGALPWRTLGDREFLDAWGNPFTYRVSPDYVDQVRGFDEQMRAGDAVVMPAIYTLTSAFGGMTVILNTHVRPPGMQFTVTLHTTGLTYVREEAAALICSAAPCSSDSTLIIQGEVATAPTLVRVDAVAAELPVVASLSAGNIISGIPVVILSHGENGYGAWTPTGNCGLDAAGISEDERQNAIRYPTVALCAPIQVTGGRQNGFVHRPFARNTSDDFDDIVSWISTEELADKLSQLGVFPVGKVPPVGLEEH